MNTNDLYLEYARCIEMCKRTNLEDTPWQRVKDSRGNTYINNPTFLSNPDDYKFAVAILEDKPVFVGDKICRLSNGRILTVMHHNELSDGSRMIQSNKFTWEPPAPKRTFQLNRVELPCPEWIADTTTSEIKTNEVQFLYSTSGKKAMFETKEDARLVTTAFEELLFGAGVK